MAKLYVAYGSNLNKEQMRYRCPTAKFVGTGIIEGYELQFKGALHGACATIAPKEGAAVPVGIWTIQKPDEKRLDLYEGYHEHGHSFYDKEQIAVKMDDGSTITGMVYIMDPRMDFGNPSAGYYDIVHRGYEDCGLDTAALNRAVSDSMDLAQHRMEREGLRLCVEAKMPEKTVGFRLPVRAAVFRKESGADAAAAGGEQSFSCCGDPVCGSCAAGSGGVLGQWQIFSGV